MEVVIFISVIFFSRSFFSKSGDYLAEKLFNKEKKNHSPSNQDKSGSN